MNVIKVYLCPACQVTWEYFNGIKCWFCGEPSGVVKNKVTDSFTLIEPPPAVDKVDIYQSYREMMESVIPW